MIISTPQGWPFTFVFLFWAPKHYPFHTVRMYSTTAIISPSLHLTNPEGPWSFHTRNNITVLYLQSNT
jgi:hypothetical protein